MQPVPATRDALIDWATAQGIADRLAWPATRVAALLPGALGPLLVPYGGALTLADLALDERWTRATLGARLGAGEIEAIAGAVRELLAREAAAVAVAIEEERALEAAPVPEVPVLAELLRRLGALRREIRRGDRTPRARDGLELPRIFLDAEAPAIVYEEGINDTRVRVTIGLSAWDTAPLSAACSACHEETACDHRLSGIDAWRLWLSEIGDAGEDIAEALLACLASPPWQRLLDDLDARPIAGVAPPAEPVAWTLSIDGGLPALTPSRDPAHEKNALPADRRAAEHLDLAGAARPSPARRFLALRDLAGHPRVARDDGSAVELREGRVTLVAEPRTGGAFALVPALDDLPLPLDALLDRIESARAGGFLLDDRGDTVCLYEVDAPARRVLDLLRRHGALFPRESHDALLARVPALSEALPVRLPPALLGEEMRADPRPVVRLTPAGTRLTVQILARPVPGGPSFAPGTGPEVASGSAAGARVFARRDLAAERLAAAHALATLPISTAWETAPGCYEPPGLDEALALVRHLEAQASGEAMRVEWPGGVAAWRVSTPRLTALELTATAGHDWFGLHGGLELDGETVELALLLEAVRRGERFVPVRGGLWFAIEGELRDRLAALADHTDDRMRVGVGAAPSLEGLLLDDEAPEALGALVDRVRSARRVAPEVPASVTATLRDYQRQGFEWLARLSAWAPGAVLADDMGLGKTLQALTLLTARAGRGPALVVAPTSVGPNWIAECRRFAPSLSPKRYGTGEDRDATLAALGPGDVLIASYGLLARDAERFARTHFETVVLDEAQAVKNPASARARAARGLDAAFRVALTGTPVENHLGELWSLLSIIVPGLLGSHRRFRERFVLPIERGRSVVRREALARLVSPFVLRRTKEQVLAELPAKVEIEVPVTLSPPERMLYEEARLAAAARIAKLPEASERDEKARFEILSALTKLRLLACHPRLFDSRSPLASSKLARTRELASELCEAGHRALVFSQFTRHLALVRAALEEDGVDCLYLDGQTRTEERARLVDAFQRGRGQVFLVSLKAGGTGLNLTGADHVIHLDPWWNPALEDQATDRAYRMGQTRSVTVLRLVARHTVEEAILALHRHKRGLARGILDAASDGAALSTEALAALLEEGASLLGDDDEEDAAATRAPAA